MCGWKLQKKDRLTQLSTDILEIVRLYLADRGAGLLPFTLASLVFVLVLLHLPLPITSAVRPALSLCILVFFVLSLIFTSVELATLNMLQPIEPRSLTEYLDSDQVLDVAVIVALYALEVLVEAHRFLLVLRDARSPRDAYRDPEEISHPIIESKA